MRKLLITLIIASLILCGCHKKSRDPEDMRYPHNKAEDIEGVSPEITNVNEEKSHLDDTPSINIAKNNEDEDSESESKFNINKYDTLKLKTIYLRNAKGHSLNKQVVIGNEKLTFTKDNEIFTIYEYHTGLDTEHISEAFGAMQINNIKGLNTDSINIYQKDDITIVEANNQENNSVAILFTESEDYDNTGINHIYTIEYNSNLGHKFFENQVGFIIRQLNISEDSMKYTLNILASQYALYTNQDASEIEGNILDKYFDKL